MKRFFVREGLKLVIDALLMAAAFFLAFYIRFDLSISNTQIELYALFVGWTVAGKLLIYYLAGVYRRIWRYTGLRDVMQILWTTCLGELLLVVVIFFIFRTSFPRSVVALDGVFSAAFIVGARIISRIIHGFGRKYPSVPYKDILIVGAGDTGESILREIQRRPELGYRPVGLLDDDPAKRGLQIHGVKVLGNRRDLARLLTQEEVQEVIICMPSVSRQVIRDIFMTCREAKVSCKTLPGIYQIIDGTVGVNQVREVQLEDILGREPVKVELADLSTYIANRSVMVTGAAGSIGSELCRQLVRLHPSKLIMLDQWESGLFDINEELKPRPIPPSVIPIVADIVNQDRMAAIFTEYRPEVIFHAAAYKHVPLMEDNVLEAVGNNLLATDIMAVLADRFGVSNFIFISTDKAVEPISVMGMTKALTERLLQVRALESSTRYVMVRFGNVMGSSGSVIPIFRQQIARGGPVTVTDRSMTRFFMTTPEATQLVIQAGAWGDSGEVFVLDMGDPISIYDLARNMITLSGFEPDRDIVVQVTGMRPGERLHEKLFWDNEKRLDTPHPKIMRASSFRVNANQFKSDLVNLGSAERHENIAEVRRLLIAMCQRYLPYPEVTTNSSH
jgi:FlaA1/EpsC-like NDP-sugar epimerase